ncbi:MAG TPA: sugar-binding domain-containing protein [Patescibacteria group bacterium]|nr:sugar-binding domain-containing protein [Patescibacteria group bacterium]
MRNSSQRPAAGPTVDLLIDLATRFYIAGQTQVEIARNVGLDPSTVSRYLKRARDEGIVRVDIQRPRSLHGDLGLELAHDFQLKRAVVVAGEPGAAANEAVAWAAADYVKSQLLNGMRLGLSWGRMLSAAVHMLPPGTVSDLDISMLHGGVGSSGAGIQGNELARHLASLHPRSRVHYLHAPVLVDSPDIKAAMMRDGSIRSALESAAASEVALVGIGTLDESAPLIRFGHISPRDRKRLLAAGAVGDMCTRFFNPAGEPVHVLDQRLIAIEGDELRRIPLVVAMAAGLEKRDAILGALRSGCLDVLVTDESTARAVLRAAKRA